MDMLRELVSMWREQAYRCDRDAAAADRRRTEINAQMGDAPTADAVRALGTRAMNELHDAGIDRTMARILSICADQLESYLVTIERTA